MEAIAKEPPRPQGDPQPKEKTERKDPQPDTDLRRDPPPQPIPGRGPLHTIPSTNIPKRSESEERETDPE